MAKPRRTYLPAFREWIRAQLCILAAREPCTCDGFLNAVTRRFVTQFCHVRSRGAGGDDRLAYPACQKHHQQQHLIGIQSFERKYGISLLKIGRALYRQYRSEHE